MLNGLYGRAVIIPQWLLDCVLWLISTYQTSIMDSWLYLYYHTYLNYVDAILLLVSLPIIKWYLFALNLYLH